MTIPRPPDRTRSASFAPPLRAHAKEAVPDCLAIAVCSLKVCGKALCFVPWRLQSFAPVQLCLLVQLIPPVVERRRARIVESQSGHLLLPGRLRVLVAPPDVTER